MTWVTLAAATVALDANGGVGVARALLGRVGRGMRRLVVVGASGRPSARRVRRRHGRRSRPCTVAPSRRGRSPRPEWRSAWCGSCCRPPRWRPTGWPASTSPSSPSLLMRTGALVFCAQHCVDSADESAVWSLYAFCLASCTTGPPPPPHLSRQPSRRLARTRRYTVAHQHRLPDRAAGVLRGVLRRVVLVPRRRDGRRAVDLGDRAAAARRADAHRVVGVAGSALVRGRVRSRVLRVAGLLVGVLHRGTAARATGRLRRPTDRWCSCCPPPTRPTSC